ncbi:MAG TPA: hypothetical protein VLC28_01830, partial [Flavitalea sp.]|nr:hypothetical protein [Flavitalea sp.]
KHAAIWNREIVFKVLIPALVFECAQVIINRNSEFGRSATRYNSEPATFLSTPDFWLSEFGRNSTRYNSQSGSFSSNF